MSAIDKEPFPRAALIGAALLIGVSIIGAATARYVRLNTPAVEQTIAPLAAREVIFADSEDGSVIVRDAAQGEVIHVVAPGRGGFVRGVMRGLARDRRSRGIGQEPPFRIAEWANGRMALEDLATGRVIELNSFGVDNRRAFSEILYAGADA
jgi:putative photosynthetic complex assembly protein